MNGITPRARLAQLSPARPAKTIGGRVDKILAMRAFVTAVKVGNLGQAANLLGITRTLASRQIKALEESLNTHLMIRTTRSLTLTAAGEDYFLFCEEILAEIDQMDAKLSANHLEVRGDLPVLCPKWMAERIARALADFVRLHPEIRPKLMLESQPMTAYEFLARGCEVAMVMRSIPDSRIKARKLMSLPYVLCAAPAFLDQAGAPTHPKDLGEYAGLVQPLYPQWLFRSGGATVKILPKPALTANSYAALCAAAVAGMGLAAVPRCLAQEDLRTGRLVEVLTDWHCEEQSLFIAYAPENTAPARAQAFVKFLPGWFNDNPL
jgi:DNA-binding transcriptional LysR family regulator